MRQRGVHELLDRDVGDAEQAARSRGEEDPFSHMQALEANRGVDQSGAEDDHGALDCDQRGRRGVLARSGRLGEPKNGQPDGGDQQTNPLPAAEMKAEEPLGDDRQEHQSAGYHGLHERQGRQRQRGDVQHPRAERDEPAHGPPLGAKQPDRAGNRVPCEDDRGRDRTALFEQDPHAARQRAADGQQQARDHPLAPA